PDESIAAGWLKEGSTTVHILEWLLASGLRAANPVVVLDRFMHERVAAKGIQLANIAVVPPWSHDEHVSFDVIGRNQFRNQFDLDRAFVVMYAGNHSPCNPLDTLFQAAERLSHLDDIKFCFVGGGSRCATCSAPPGWPSGGSTRPARSAATAPSGCARSTSARSPASLRARA